MLLTVEVELTKASEETPAVGEVALCFDEEGRKLLLDRLQKLGKSPDHVHMFTPSWGGHELSEEKQGGDNFILANHLRLVRF